MAILLMCLDIKHTKIRFAFNKVQKMWLLLSFQVCFLLGSKFGELLLRKKIFSAFNPNNYQISALFILLEL